MKFRVFRQLVGKVSKNVGKKLGSTVRKVLRVAEKHFNDLVEWIDNDYAVDELGNEYLVVEDQNGLNIFGYEGLTLRNMLDVEDFIDSVAEIKKYGSIALEDDFELNGVLVFNLMKYFSITMA